MNRKTSFGLLAALVLLLALAGPLAASEQTFEFSSPGCTA